MLSPSLRCPAGVKRYEDGEAAVAKVATSTRCSRGYYAVSKMDSAAVMARRWHPAWDTVESTGPQLDLDLVQHLRPLDELEADGDTPISSNETTMHLSCRPRPPHDLHAVRVRTHFTVMQIPPPLLLFTALAFSPPAIIAIANNAARDVLDI